MAQPVKIIKQTVLDDRGKFDISNCLGFSIANEGAFAATYGYEGMEQTFELAVGDTKLFGFLPAGYIFQGVMGVEFTGSNNGKLSITLFKAVILEK